MKRLLFLLALLCGLASAQVDIRINSIGPYIDLARNVTWASTGVGTLTNNYILTPTIPDQGVCLYIRNNQAAVRSFNVVFAITGDQTVNSYQGNTGQWQVVNSGVATSQVAASTTFNTFVKLTGAARVAIVVTSGGGAGTASAFVVLTSSGGCGVSPNPVTVPLRIFADKSFQLTQSHVAKACVTNPTANQDILSLNTPATAVAGIYLDRVRISSTAAAEVDFDTITTTGTTCTAVTSFNPSMGAGTGAALLAKTESCGTDPVIGVVIYPTHLQASDTREIDLQGFFTTNSTGAGGFVMVTPPANVTGTVCAELSWSEVF